MQSCATTAYALQDAAFGSIERRQVISWDAVGQPNAGRGGLHA